MSSLWVFYGPDALSAAQPNSVKALKAQAQLKSGQQKNWKAKKTDMLISNSQSRESVESVLKKKEGGKDLHSQRIVHCFSET